MSYITPAELAERPGARELAQIASAEHQAVVEAALMDATLRGTDRSGEVADRLTADLEGLGGWVRAPHEGLVDGHAGHPSPQACDPPDSATPPATGGPISAWMLVLPASASGITISYAS